MLVVQSRYACGTVLVRLRYARGARGTLVVRSRYARGAVEVRLSYSRGTV